MLGASAGAWSLNSKPEQCLLARISDGGGLENEGFSFNLSQSRPWGVPIPGV